MNTFYDSLKLKLMLTTMVVLFIVIAIVHLTMYFIIRHIVSEQLGHSAMSVAVSVSAAIMMDIDAYKEFMKTRDVDSEYYQAMQQYFARIKTNSHIIKFIFTEHRLDADTAEYLLDAAPVPGDDYEYPSPPGETTVVDETSRTVYDTGRPAILPPTLHPAYGTLLGGCAPILDEDGTMLGLVGVNMDISAIFYQLARLQYSMLVLYGVILISSFVLLNKYSQAILEPIIKDKMTGAYNKRYYETLIRMELQNAAKNGTEVAILMLDLDHFKQINDTYGHVFGDKVLTEVSKTVMRCLRADDYFIRYGGEEFVVILSNVPLPIVQNIAERIRASVEKTDIYNDALNHAINMTISIGITHQKGNGGATGKELVERADAALYKAKETRNTVSLFTSPAC